MNKFSIRPWLTVGWMLGALLFAAQARADIAPEPDRIEQGLTIALLLIAIGATVLIVIERRRKQ